jgi:hypothetical protein
VDWVQLAQDSIHWGASVNTVLTFGIYKKNAHRDRLNVFKKRPAPSSLLILLSQKVYALLEAQIDAR